MPPREKECAARGLMLFNSLTFVVFFAIVVALHYSPFPWRVKKFNLLIASYLFLSHHSGENDGMVPKQAQRWGEVLGEIEADHWAQIGWAGLQQRFDAPSFYARVLRELRGRGF